MELGATICKPTNPDCENCPLLYKCISRKENTISLRPVKIKATKPVVRYMDFAVLESESDLVFKKRTEDDIWKGLHDFTSVEGLGEPNETYITGQLMAEFPEINLEMIPGTHKKEYIHLLSHQRIIARFWHYKYTGTVKNNSVYFSVPKHRVDLLAVPRLIHKYLEDENFV